MTNNRHDDEELSLCPLCGSDMVEREGKFGRFLGCTTFPKCRGTRQISASSVPTANEAEADKRKDNEFKIAKAWAERKSLRKHTE